MSITKALKRLGDWLDDGEARVNMRGAAATKGDLLMFDLGATDGDVETNELSSLGAEDHQLANVVAPATAGIVTSQWVFCVALEDIAEDQPGRVGVMGLYEVDCIAALTEGDNLFALNGSTTATNEAGAATGSAALGTVLDSTASATLKFAYFNGFNMANVVA